MSKTFAESAYQVSRAGAVAGLRTYPGLPFYDLVIVGADRIAANGDVANKIGTYSLAILAKEHAIPFYVAAPLSTIDRTIDSGADIPIEQRPAEEVRQVGIQPITDPEVEVENPAFDVTPARYIRGIITETGVALPPNRESIAALFA